MRLSPLAALRHDREQYVFANILVDDDILQNVEYPLLSAIFCVKILSHETDISYRWYV
jgi:hypothetical protein